jgi:ubiquinone biosynthesis protein UbiJ
MIKKYSFLVLQKAINKALTLDDTMHHKLVSLDGKVLEIIVMPINVHFFIRFAEGAVYLMDKSEGLADATLQSHPLGFLKLSLLPSTKVRALFNDSVTITGDVELGQRVKAIVDGLDIDWEGHLARLTGDVVAYKLGSLVRRSFAFQQQCSESLQQNITEFLQEEVRLFPPRDELEDFFKDIDDISLRVERLEARMNQQLPVT